MTAPTVQGQCFARQLLPGWELPCDGEWFTITGVKERKPPAETVRVTIDVPGAKDPASRFTDLELPRQLVCPHRRPAGYLMQDTPAA